MSMEAKPNGMSTLLKNTLNTRLTPTSASTMTAWSPTPKKTYRSL